MEDRSLNDKKRLSDGEDETLTKKQKLSNSDQRDKLDPSQITSIIVNEPLKYMNSDAFDSLIPDINSIHLNATHKLTNGSLALIGQLTRLTDLHLTIDRYSEVTPKGLNHLSTLTNLENLSVQIWNDQVKASSDYLINMHHLTQFNGTILPRNISVLKGLTKLQHLSLYTTVTSEFFDQLVSISNLASLDLLASDIECRDFARLTACSKLTQLKADDLAVFDSVDDALAANNEYLHNVLALTSLQYLEFALCADFNRLVQLTNLKDLLLRAHERAPAMTIDDIRELKTLPNLVTFALASPLSKSQVKELFAGEDVKLFVDQQ
eukprot:TRINITY_DN12506_c0_g1_i1.p1 TRINITY_DN12506_c0_g1~~TRINITY_DN12506_c0_g1_i1.p1  ORF type:complete len:322 (-),score=44.34 TRINITY_DN12506_c0_g1_i1:21-986(-)